MPTALTPLHQLFQDQWDAWMRFDPIFATYVGDNRYNDRLPSATEASFRQWHQQLVDFRSRLVGIDRTILTQEDQLTYDLFNHLVTNEIVELGFNPQRLPISRCAGFHLSFPDLFQNTPFEDEQDYENYISRLNGFQQYALENIELMRTGLRTGYLPPQCTLTDIDVQL
jgi:uncharacterized protein (DUF885 family)